MNDEYDEISAPLQSDLSGDVFDAIDNLATVVNSRTSSHPQGPLGPIDSQSCTAAHPASQTNALDETTAPPPQNPSTAVSPSPVPRSHSPSSSSSRYSPYYRPASGQTQRPSVSKQRTDPQIPLRLNADLSVTNDPSVRPYACGHRQCWPADAAVTTSSACFATSRELGDHSKKNHANDVLGGGTPFRCALSGCGKSWKSINGLQYHLQISKAHFQQALSLSSHPASPGPTAPSSQTNNQSATKTKTKKVHPCTHPNCSNQYKQLSGLRYHLAHGHPDPHDVPVQLDVVPPTLARKVAEKLSSRCPRAST